MNQVTSVDQKGKYRDQRRPWAQVNFDSERVLKRDVKVTFG